MVLCTLLASAFFCAANCLRFEGGNEKFVAVLDILYIVFMIIGAYKENKLLTRIKDLESKIRMIRCRIGDKE